MKEKTICRPANNPDEFHIPGVVAAFNIFGWLGAIAGIIMLVMAVINRDSFMMVPSVTVFISGLFYLAAAVIVRSTAETAWNTAKLLQIQCEEDIL